MIFLIILIVILLVVFVAQVYIYYGKMQRGEFVQKGWLKSEQADSVPAAQVDENGISIELKAQLAASIDDPSFGPDDAKVTIVEFSDFQCSFCKQAYPEVREMIGEYGDRVRFIYRDFPLEIIHENSLLSAQAAECADDQKLFWPMHDKIFDGQDDLSYSALMTMAEEAGLAVKTFEKCLNSNKYMMEVKEDFRDGGLLGVEGTPTFFINGVKYAGPLKFEMFKQIIERELAK